MVGCGTNIQTQTLRQEWNQSECKNKFKETHTNHESNKLIASFIGAKSTIYSLCLKPLMLLLSSSSSSAIVVVVVVIVYAT